DRTPASRSVGTSGRSLARLASVTAMANARPDFRYGRIELSGAIMAGIWPATRSMIAGAVPLYGTCTIGTFAARAKSPPARCGGEAGPGQLELTPPGGCGASGAHWERMCPDTFSPPGGSRLPSVRPGGNGTTMRIGLFGNVCAVAAVTATTITSAASFSLNISIPRGAARGARFLYRPARLAARIAVDAAGDGPLGEHLRARRELARLPRRSHVVLVGVVPGESPGGA